jgi:tripartite-type tricarboxylate transporter receptor subunit TctC
MSKLIRSVVSPLFWLLALCCGAGSQAQTFPNRPIEIILPAASGGTTDTALRLMASRWQEFLGQPVVVVNVPGAGGAIGANRAARAKPDGYTLLSGFDSLLVALPFVQKSVEYNLDSFDYLGGYGLGALYFTVRSDSPYKSMPELIKGAKENAGRLNFGSYGIGVITHFAAERLWQLTDVKMTYLPYKSSPETIFALLGKQIDVAVTAGAGPAKGNPQARIIAVAGDQRRPDQPDVPTLKELGYPVSLDYIAAILAPKGLPPDVRKTLVSAFNKANEKYGDEFKRELESKADLLYKNISGEQVKETWHDRQAWFRDLVPSMHLQPK